MKTLFWFSLLFIAYTYAGYPLALLVWSRLFPKRIHRSKELDQPSVTVVMAARNAEAVIAERIENLLQQDYPPERLEIIVVSDGSSDLTNDIVKRIIAGRSIPQSHSPASASLQLIEIIHHRGKPHALNCGVSQARGEFIVFADSRQQFDSGVVRELVANFSDPSVGCVTGELVFFEGTDTRIEVEMGAYWTYEKKIRKMEGVVHSVAGATGAIYAIRKALFPRVPERTILDDVFVPMYIVLSGYRTVFEAKAIAYDRISEDFTSEKKRKVRTLLGNYQLLQYMPALLIPWRNPIFVQFLSHKLLRLLVPFVFLIMMLTALVLDGFLYRAAFVLCALVLASPFVGVITSPVPIAEKARKLAQTFVFLNTYAVLALILFIARKEKDVW